MVRAHVGTEVFRVPAADGKQAALVGTAEGDERRGTDAVRGRGEEPAGPPGIEGAAADSVTAGRFRVVGRGWWLIVKEEGNGLGLELAAQRLVQPGLQSRAVWGGNELDHQAMEAGGEGLVVPDTGDELGQELAIALDLVAQQAELMFDQGQSARRAMGQAQAGGKVRMAEKKLRIGLQVGGDGLVPSRGWTLSLGFFPGCGWPPDLVAWLIVQSLP